MKKLLLTLGSTAAIAVPIATVVACGDMKTVLQSPAIGMGEFDLRENPGRYGDSDAKALIGDNIKEDGYTAINVPNGGDLHEDEGYETIDVNGLINTDMNIPDGVVGFSTSSTSSASGGVIFNNEVVVPSEGIHLAYETMNSMGILGKYTIDYEFSGSTLKNGITLSDDLKYIPNHFLNDAIVEKEGDPDYKISIPSSVEIIDNFAFKDIQTDVIDYDFSHLVNGDIYEENRDMFTSDLYNQEPGFSGDEINLPLFNHFESGGAEGHIFDYDTDEYDGPNLIKYRSEEPGTINEFGAFMKFPPETNGSNIY